MLAKVESLGLDLLIKDNIVKWTFNGLDMDKYSTCPFFIWSQNKIEKQIPIQEGCKLQYWFTIVNAYN